MFGNRKITCTNEDRVEISFTETEFTPFLLAKAAGIYDTNNTVTTTTYNVMDGAAYQGSVTKPRNIVLTLIDKEPFDANRDLIDVVFERGKLGHLVVEDDSHTRGIIYYTESVTSTATPGKRFTTISLLCPDPFFHDEHDTHVYIANLVPVFEFIHEFYESEELGYFNDERIGTIVNETAETAIGLTMKMKAWGTVVNPVITKIETQEHIALGTQADPFTMHFGDYVIIQTTTGSKNIFDEHGNSVNQYLTEGSTFFQLNRGVNSIGYSADSGEDYISVDVAYNYRYMRA